MGTCYLPVLWCKQSFQIVLILRARKMSEFGPDFGKQASGTFENYLAGTVLLVFIVFFIFIIMSIFTMMLMGYARYNTRPPIHSIQTQDSDGSGPGGYYDTATQYRTEYTVV